MLLKIVAGAVAALAVIGIGVYVAMPSDSGCGSKCPVAAIQEECCGHGVCPSEPVDSSDSVGCCAACTAKPVDTDAFAACGGGLSSVPATKSKAKIACCSE